MTEAGGACIEIAFVGLIEVRVFNILLEVSDQELPAMA